MIIFGKGRGRVVRLQGPATVCRVSLLKTDPDFPFATTRSIVTGLAVDSQVNIQFLHAMSRLVYVYVFGDRIGSTMISGVSFACDGTNGCDDQANDEHGLAKMLTWYQTNKASKRRRPIRITIGNQPIEGFLLRFLPSVNEAGLMVAEWRMELATLPEDS